MEARPGVAVQTGAGAPEQTFGPYAMRVPIGYTVEKHDFPSNKAQITAYVFGGPKRKDGSAAQFALLDAVTQPGYTTKNFETLLATDKRLNAPDIVKSDMEIGEINGISVARRYYKSPATATDPVVGRSFQYVAAEGSSFFIFSAFANEPSSTDLLPLCEAAARTLRKVNP